MPWGAGLEHYIPSKAAGSQETNSEIENPLVRYAFEIVKKTQLELPILNYPYGVNGYNVKIKKLKDRFALMNVAFEQEDYWVIENLEVIG